MRRPDPAAAPREGDYSYLVPARFAAKKERWYAPQPDVRDPGARALDWSLRVPLDDGPHCAEVANDWYPAEWGSGDYWRASEPPRGALHRTAEGMLFRVDDSDACPPREASVLIARCGHGGVAGHEAGECVGGTYAWVDGICGRFHRPIGAGPICVGCGPASRARAACPAARPDDARDERIAGLAALALHDSRHMFGPRNFRLDGRSGVPGLWEEPPRGRVHVLDGPVEPWRMFFTVSEDDHTYCRMAGVGHGVGLCAKGTYLWADGHWGEFHLPSDRVPMCTYCKVRPGRGAACTRVTLPPNSSVVAATNGTRPPFYMAFLASGSTTRGAWEGMSGERLHRTPFGTYYFVSEAHLPTGRALTAQGHGFAFHGERWHPLRCSHCGVGRAAGNTECGGSFRIPTQLLDELEKR